MTTIQHTIGPDFANEIFAANLNGLPIVWDSNSVSYDETVLTSAQVTSLTAVIVAHNPATIPPVTAAQALAAGYAYLATQGWGPTNLQAVAGGFAFLSTTLQGQYQENYLIITTMYNDATTSPSTFNAQSYTVPHAPVVFGLKNNVTS